jgi:hypothetical protein
MKYMNEEILTGMIQGTIIPDATKNGEFDPSDLSSVEHNMELELKCITKHYGRVMIERKKYDELFELPNEPKLRYVVSTPKGVWSFDLRKIIIPDDWWQQILIGNVSTYYHRNINETYKLVAFLPLGWAKNISTQIGWEQGM